MTSSLCLHTGARHVSYDELAQVEIPPATKTWVPVKHSTVIDTVQEALRAGGFSIERTEYALTRQAARMFATMNLSAPVGHGVHLAVGVRNSLDKSLPLGFCAGNHVFCCDNLAFRSELLVHRKHTVHGATRFQEAICKAVGSLHQFKEVEAERIRKFQYQDLSEDAAALYMLQAFEENLVSHVLLKKVIQEWRQPTFEEFEPRTMWSLLNAFTTALASRAKSNPQQFARTTIQLQDLLDRPKANPAGTVVISPGVSNP